ncbi:MAG: hypothetical protein MZV63_44840 [Marinilabiliales bacterium]|nr:hypothetical protein [Marinilabiliales bacterium]
MIRQNCTITIGNSMLQNQKVKESIDAYKEALRNNPNDMDTKHNLAYAQKLMQQQQQQKISKINKDDEKDQNKRSKKKTNKTRINKISKISSSSNSSQRFQKKMLKDCYKLWQMMKRKLRIN